MKTVIEMAHEVFDRMPPDRHCREPYWTATDAELERFAELVRADKRNATLEEIAKWLEGEKDAPYWAELVRARRSNT